MRALAQLTLAALAALALAAPAQALTITARVTGGTIAVHAGPDDRFPIDSCTQVDSDSQTGTWFGDGGHPLWPNGSTQWCRIPDFGWVDRSYLTGRGLVNVTPPDFNGPGW
jgi:hypothetical protein